MSTQRLRLEWINASEGELFASTVEEMREIVNGLRRKEIEKSKGCLGGEEAKNAFRFGSKP